MAAGRRSAFGFNVVMQTALAVALLAASVGFTQEESFDARELNFRAYVTLLRADIKAQRKDIVTQLMEFNDTDAAKFWPIFQQYDAELTTIGDGRTQLIVDYARDYESLTNDQADALMSKAFELEARRAQFGELVQAAQAAQASLDALKTNAQQVLEKVGSGQWAVGSTENAGGAGQ